MSRCNTQIHTEPLGSLARLLLRRFTYRVFFSLLKWVVLYKPEVQAELVAAFSSILSEDILAMPSSPRSLCHAFRLISSVSSRAL